LGWGDLVLLGHLLLFFTLRMYFDTMTLYTESFSYLTSANHLYSTLAFVLMCQVAQSNIVYHVLSYRWRD
jgi:hypothetical protein